MDSREKEEKRFACGSKLNFRMAEFYPGKPGPEPTDKFPSAELKRPKEFEVLKKLFLHKPQVLTELYGFVSRFDANAYKQVTESENGQINFRIKIPIALDSENLTPGIKQRSSIIIAGTGVGDLEKNLPAIDEMAIAIVTVSETQDNARTVAEDFFNLGDRGEIQFLGSRPTEAVPEIGVGGRVRRVITDYDPNHNPFHIYSSSREKLQETWFNEHGEKISLTYRPNNKAGSIILDDEVMELLASLGSNHPNWDLPVVPTIEDEIVTQDRLINALSNLKDRREGRMPTQEDLLKI